MIRWFVAACALALCGCGSDDDTNATASNVGGQSGSGGSGSTGGSGGNGGTGGSGGSVSGGGGSQNIDSGSAGSASVDAGSGGSGGITAIVLLDQTGVVFVPSESETMKKIFVGENGHVYTRIRVEFDLLAGGWQPEVPDEGNPDRTEHILFGLFRDHQSKSDNRYLMGTAATTFATKGPHFRMFGRLSIGPTYVTYTQWTASYGWSEGTQYRVDCLLDGVVKTQRCALLIAGTLEKELIGDVAYLDPVSHLNTGFYIELGRAVPTEIETSPLGWTYSNLLVTATD